MRWLTIAELKGSLTEYLGLKDLHGMFTKAERQLLLRLAHHDQAKLNDHEYDADLLAVRGLRSGKKSLKDAT